MVGLRARQDQTAGKLKHQSKFGPLRRADLHARYIDRWSWANASASVSQRNPARRVVKAALKEATRAGLTW